MRFGGVEDFDWWFVVVCFDGVFIFIIGIVLSIDVRMLCLGINMCCGGDDWWGVVCFGMKVFKVWLLVICCIVECFMLFDYS